MKIQEGELTFSFKDEMRVEQFDRTGRKWPPGIRPVDFIVETSDETILIEVKDPSAEAVPDHQIQQYIKRLQTKKLTHEELAPKARSTYTFLHLMRRDHQRMRYVVVLGTERLSLQPALLLNLTDQLRKRLRQEADEPWQRQYIEDCLIVQPADLPKAIPGSQVQREGSS